MELQGAESLADPQSNFSILLGRTGTGKTAILKHIESTKQNSIVISAENLSLNYIANSTVLQYFDNIGASLDPFYKLLWQHVFVVELIKSRFSIQNAAELKSKRNFLKEIFRNDSEKQALDYFEKWHEKFWQRSEIRIKEIVSKVEDHLQASLGVSLHSITADAMAGSKVTDETRAEVISKANAAIMEEVHLKELQTILTVLDRDVFSEQQKPYYLLIDALDEDWVDDALRFKLIRALIECIKSFRRLRNVKVIMTLRDDLKETVFRTTTSKGFQHEKYESLFFKLRWTRANLSELIERRIDHTFKDRYTKQIVSSKDVFSNTKIGKESPVDYIISRTLNRPREVVLFMNKCLEKANGKAKIDRSVIVNAEHSYSRDRLKSLYEEWKDEHPLILQYAELFRAKRTPMKVSRIKFEEVTNLMEALVVHAKSESDPIYAAFMELYTQSSSETASNWAKQTILSMFYKVGLIGIKVNKTSPRQWSYIDDPLIDPREISDESTFDIHVGFRSALGITNAPDGDD